MKKVVFASFAKFPRGDSNAIHFVNIGSIFCDLGYDVSYLGYGSLNSNDEFGHYYSLKKTHKNSFLAKVINHLNMGGRLCKVLKHSFNVADVVVLSGCLKKNQFKNLRKYFLIHSPKTNFVLSMTEEYTRDEFDNFDYFVKRGFKINKYLNNEFDDKATKILAISSYLNDKFLNKGFESLYLPFVFSDKFNQMPESVKHDKINFLYCGSPDNKDKLLEMLEAFSQLDKEFTRKIHLNLVGINETWINERNSNLYGKLKDFATCFGRKDYEFVRNIYAESDYSILLRDGNKTFVKAGCPTKIVESLFYGVCPVTNLTSDLGKYLEDGVNSIVVKDCSVESFEESLINSINNFDKINNLKKNARLTYEKHFKASNYKDKVKEFLQL